MNGFCWNLGRYDCLDRLPRGLPTQQTVDHSISAPCPWDAGQTLRTSLRSLAASRDAKLLPVCLTKTISALKSSQNGFPQCFYLQPFPRL
ncbi:hypothetical protein PoB_004667100 [Plakobranchus ocellatus]|uniref:Uncharacterized protein n=1 Tax=Plakobranchus ocellatus TaxID=259542 RepID=A0AAV4BIA5_9GAST|nr:hypothetical protein PoB_004667100 [Plakobranchus ocellatus]